MKTIEDYREQLEAALAYGSGTHLFEDVVEAVASGKMQAWPNGESIVITEVLTYPRKRALHCFLAAGNRHEIMEMLPGVSAFGRSMGCTVFTMAGRTGWDRVLRKYGWEKTYHCMAMPL